MGKVDQSSTFLSIIMSASLCSFCQMKSVYLLKSIITRCSASLGQEAEQRSERPGHEFIFVHVDDDS